MKQLRGYEGKNGSVDTRELYDQALKKYGGMSQDALVSKLIEIVHAQKQAGTFDEVQLLGFINTISPHLNSAQRARLESVLGMIGD